MVYNGHEIVVTQEMVNELIDGIVIVGEGAVSVIDTVEIEGITVKRGLYFAKSEEGQYTSSLTYGNETIHKIDQKYIPGGSGGAMVVTFEFNGNNINCDKTVTEVRTAMAQGTPVIGIVTEDGNSQGIGPCLYDMTSGSIGFVRWIIEGELVFMIEGPDGSNDWRLVGA